VQFFVQSLYSSSSSSRIHVHKESILLYRIRWQAFSLCKPPVFSFPGLDSQRIPVPEHFPHRDPVERCAPAFDQISDRLRDEMERDVRDLFCSDVSWNRFTSHKQQPHGCLFSGLRSNGWHCSEIQPRFHSAGTHSPVIAKAVSGTGRCRTGRGILHTFRLLTAGKSGVLRRGPRNHPSGR